MVRFVLFLYIQYIDIKIYTIFLFIPHMESGINIQKSDITPLERDSRVRV